MEFANRIAICHRCPRRGKPDRGVMACLEDGRDVIAHACADACPLGRFTSHTERSSVQEIISALDVLPHTWPNVQAAWRGQLAEQIAAPTPIYQDAPRPRGIVMAGGGKYLASLYVGLCILRRQIKTTLPVEVWHLGADEMLHWQRDALLALGGVSVHDATAVAPVRHGYEIKSIAVQNCSFDHVAFFDADSFPLIDPDALFDTDKYLRCGAVVCQDQERFDLTDEQVAALGLRPGEADDRRGFENGQFLIDRRRQWRAVRIWRWLDSHSNYYYRHGLGDCLTLHMALNLAGCFEWADPSRWRWETPAVIHQWDGVDWAVHRINGKLQLGAEQFYSDQTGAGRNDRLPYEARVWEYFEEFRRAAARYADLPDVPLPGDVLESMARAMGAARLAAWWQKLTGTLCGCEERQAKINNASRKLLAWWDRRGDGGKIDPP